MAMQQKSFNLDLLLVDDFLLMLGTSKQDLTLFESYHVDLLLWSYDGNTIIFHKETHAQNPTTTPSRIWAMQTGLSFSHVGQSSASPQFPNWVASVCCLLPLFVETPPHPPHRKKKKTTTTGTIHKQSQWKFTRNLGGKENPYPLNQPATFFEMDFS